MKRVSQVLRAAMVDAEKRGVSLYRIAKECELDDSIVYRFYHDECGLALSSVDRLCIFLGYELTENSVKLRPLPLVEKKPAEKAGATRKSPGKKKKKSRAMSAAAKKAAGGKKTAKKKTVKKKATGKKSSGAAVKKKKRKTAGKK